MSRDKFSTSHNKPKRRNLTAFFTAYTPQPIIIPRVLAGMRNVREPETARPEDRYAVGHVSGNCLTGVHICDGDYLVFLLTKEAEDGALVVATVPMQESKSGKGIFVKFFYREPDGRIRFESRHPDFPPKYCQPDEVEIIGRVVRIERDIEKREIETVEWKVT